MPCVVQSLCNLLKIDENREYLNEWSETNVFVLSPSAGTYSVRSIGDRDVSGIPFDWGRFNMNSRNGVIYMRTNENQILTVYVGDGFDNGIVISRGSDFGLIQGRITCSFDNLGIYRRFN